MTANEVVTKIKALGGELLRRKGSHARYECACGKHQTTVAMHNGDIPLGTLRAIQKQLA
jgi:predicted RNA binding protein YcfA (HicA-like mRNA interferase family)